MPAREGSSIDIDRALPRDVGARKNQLPSDQQTNRSSDQIPQVDADTGEEVDAENIIKGYQVGKDQYIEIDPEELEAIAIESKRTIEIDEFVPKKEMDELYLNSPYLHCPRWPLAR
jgi:non-homologous end joining protein Ku